MEKLAMSIDTLSLIGRTEQLFEEDISERAHELAELVSSNRFLVIGGVSILLISRMPKIDCCRVLGIGVAERDNKSTPGRTALMLSLCLTPNRCSSSIINKPN